MSNPIDGIGRGHGPVVTDTGGVRAAQKPVGGSAPATPDGDRVKLTDTASSLQQIEKQMASEPAVDPARVAAVKDALSAGDYKIDAERVAEKFIEVERALGKV